MGKTAKIVVVGTGWVGSRLLDSLGAGGGVVGWSPTSVPLSERSSDLGRLIQSTGARVVVNAAGLLVGSPAELGEANTVFPAWLCSELRHSGVRLIHLGSAAEYGDPGSALPIAEDRSCRPSGEYGRTKLTGTLSVLDAAQHLDVVVLRVFNLVGPGAPASSPIADFAAAVDRLVRAGADIGGEVGGVIDLWWPATQRDVIAVDDLARSILDVANVDVVPPLINVCSGSAVEFGDVAVALGRRRGHELTVRSLDRPGVAAVIGDPGLLCSAVGRAPVAMNPDSIARAVWPDVRVQSGR